MACEPTPRRHFSGIAVIRPLRTQIGKRYATFGDQSAVREPVFIYLPKPK